MVNEKYPFDTSIIVKDLSIIKDPKTYFETVRKVLMCPGTSFAQLKKSEINR